MPARALGAAQAICPDNPPASQHCSLLSVEPPHGHRRFLRFFRRIERSAIDHAVPRQYLSPSRQKPFGPTTGSLRSRGVVVRDATACVQSLFVLS